MRIRVQKVEELLKQQISILIREKLPEGLGMVTVTDVQTPPDFKLATVFIALIPDDKEREVLAALAKLTPELQHTLGKQLKMRNTPKLIFKIDRSREEIDKVEEILKEIK